MNPVYTPEEKLRIPDFFIVGSAKSGTTSLWNWLGQHPEIFMTKDIRLKELGHYADHYRLENLKDYLFYFREAKNNQLIGEVCNAYLTAPESPSKIKKDNPNAKIIIILRNPVGRAYSLYNWSLKEGYETAPTFELALEKEKKLLGGKTLEEIGPEVIKDPVQTYFRHYFYFASGFYSRQIKRYFDIFGRENCLVIIFDDLKQNPCAILEEIFEFLEVDSSFKPEMRIENSGKRPYSIRLQFFFRQKLGRWLRRFGFSEDWSKRIPRKLIKINASRRIMPMKKETRLMLKEQYADDIKATAELIGRDLNSWL